MLILTIAAIVFAVLLARAFDRIRTLERSLAELEARLLPSSAIAEEPIPAARALDVPPSRDEPIAEPVVSAPLAEPLAEPEPSMPDAPELAPEPRPPFNLAATFENLVGGKLPIWIGGAALILSAFFLVRYSIESGLLGPGVRATLGALFGVTLLGASEFARRYHATAADPRIGQALAGAGIASLYGTLYMAAELYALVGALPAFVLMVAITVTALGLSLRHGPPTAIMGLVGGFAAPLVTGLDSANVAPLLIYLALFTAGLFALAIHRGWLWLALAATGGGFAWPLILMALSDQGELPFVGLFVLTLAFIATLALPRVSTVSPLLRLAPLVTGLVQLVLLAPQLEFSPLAWGLYALLSAAALWLGWRDRRLAPGAGAALGLVLLLLAIALLGSDPQRATLAAIVFALMFGGAGLALFRREGDGRLWTGIALAGAAAPLLLANAIEPQLMRPIGWALLALVATLPCAWISWTCRDRARPERRFDLGLTGGAAVAALLLGAGLAQPLPELGYAPLFAALATGLAAWARQAKDGSLTDLSLVPLPFAGAGWLVAPSLLDYLESVIGAGAIPAPSAIIALGLLPAALLGAQGWLMAGHRACPALHWIAWLLALSLPTALVPAPWHAPLLALVTLAACVGPLRRLLPRHGEIAAFVATLAAMLPQLGAMAMLLGYALEGGTLPYTYLPPLVALLREVGLPAALLAALFWLRPAAVAGRWRMPLGVAFATALLATLYALAKQPLAIATQERFLALGLLERAVLTQLLLAAGVAILLRAPRLRSAAIVLLALAALRFALFDLLLLNPVFVDQQVGALPLLNLATLHPLLAAFWLLLATRSGAPARICRGSAMALTVIAVLGAVRQLIHGTILTAPQITTTENYLYSVGLLALSLIWLWRGIAARIADLRLVGLALLTLVTCKVFLVDAAALTGVLRILSFLGLGLALIAIGWAYGRFLGTPRPEPAAQAN